MRLKSALLVTVLLGAILSPVSFANVIDIGNRRELFVDHYLIDRLDGVSLTLQEPRDEGVALWFNQPWEGPWSGYATVVKVGEIYRLYYRGKPRLQQNGKFVDDGTGEFVCIAESKDGKEWYKPVLDLIEFNGNKKNAIVMNTDGDCHNFSPFIDSNPNVKGAERFKAFTGVPARTDWIDGDWDPEAGIRAYASPDGLTWTPMNEGRPVIRFKDLPESATDIIAFDSQNVGFYSEKEEKYVAYFRIHLAGPPLGGLRRIMRAESEDFIHWKNFQLMEFDGPPTKEFHYYTNQTTPYFRAPHIYVSLAARLIDKRRYEATEHGQPLPNDTQELSDAVFLSTRGGNIYQRTFPEAFLRPGLAPGDWRARTNYPGLGIIQTGENEMSFYASQDYTRPTAHLRRYSLRLDGFSAITAPASGGEFVTKPLTFSGNQLSLNYSTSAAGSILVEIQDADGVPLPGFSLKDARELIGNEIEGVYKWKNGSDVSVLSGKPVRLRFVMSDAKLYSLKFK